MKDKIPARSQKIFILLSLVIGLVFSIVFAEWVLQYQRQSVDRKIKTSEEMQPGMILYDAQLGWKLKPFWSGSHQHYDYNVTYNINSKGFRGVNKKAVANVYSVIGDSFSFGLGVNDKQVFSELINANDKNTFHLNNYSVPGYSTDQQLLLLKKNKANIGKKLFLVVYLGNDIFDNMRSYPLQTEYGKPFFVLNNNFLALKNTPVPLLPKPAAARKDSISSLVLGDRKSKNTFMSWVSDLEINRRLSLYNAKTMLSDNEMSKRFSGSLAVFYALLYEMEKTLINKTEITVVLLPGRSYVEQPESLSAQYQAFFQQQIKTTLLSSTSINVFDLASHLGELHKNGITHLYHPNEGHFTAKGHQFVADYLAAEINKSENP